VRIINEGSATELKAAIRGDDGSLTTPTTLKYRVDDPRAGVITGWTALSPSALTNIPIPAATNAMRDDSRPYEDRQVMVMSNEGLSSQQVTYIEYRVRNLSAI
jgi:hypothetical protein